MEFTWDPAKDLTNRAKHGLGFADILAVFHVPDDCVEIFDEQHSQDEPRFITMGPCAHGLVAVCWTETEPGLVRLISARRLTRKEVGLYHREMEVLRG